jgi:tRNA-specific 2-thiouridylase
VDSSLAVHLLHAAGHRVTAHYLQIWFQEDFRNSWDACPWEEDLEYCRAVCARLGVPLHVVPLSTQYWDRVVAHSIAEIRAGRTPNPDVLCNSRVKFGAFLEHLEAVEAAGGPRYDRVASGHYARVERAPAPHDRGPPGGTHAGGGEGGEARLALTPDAVKDQTYFLAHLAPRQLARLCFPLGSLTKPQVRALAAAAALPNQARKDSQGICFLGRVRFDEFVREHLGEWPGALVEEESGRVVGFHRGFWFHTVGQRKGVRLAGGPWYVTRKDPGTNAVYVSRRYFDPGAAARRGAFACADFSWTSDLRPDPGAPLQCKVRHGPHLYGCTLEVEGAGGAEVGRVVLDGSDQGLAAGQYAVFYQRGYCLGCAVITEAM